MKIKKLVAMFLTLALAVSMVACMTSCGSKDTGKKESFSQRVKSWSFRVSFRSFYLIQKPHKTRLFRP